MTIDPHFGRLPLAVPGKRAKARVKATPEDFLVDELRAAAPSGAGEHLYLHVEKRLLETRQVARRLAELYGVAAVDVGYAGMKDKRAVARQWLSVRTSLGPEVAERGGLVVLAAGRDERKLRRGELAGNRFEIRLCEVSGDDWRDRLGRVFESGAPNYFGPQRFGGDNLDRALAWLPVRRRRSISPFRRGLYLSVLRSLLFNAVLARRVQEKTWRALLPGDVDLDGMPTAPLWGRGRSATSGVALAAESAALAPFADVLDGLEHAGVDQARRSLVLLPQNAWVAEEDEAVRLGFELPPGGYATSLLREAFELGEATDGAPAS